MFEDDNHSSDSCKLVCVYRMASQPIQALLKQSHMFTTKFPMLCENDINDDCYDMVDD